MATTLSKDSSPNPSWFTTKRGDFNLKNFQDGVLSAAFMVGLLVASPIFASSAKSPFYNTKSAVDCSL